MDGVYQFIYISLKIFLNNCAFEEAYLSPELQSQLVLVVVSKAHRIIYSWGLVESGKRHLKILVQNQDAAIFFPFYGNIGSYLLNNNRVPCL